jgi:protein arginine kinase activator
MICSVCKQNEATVHLSQIIDNKMQTIDLCESCSKAKGVDDPTGFSLASILLGLGATQEGGEATATEELKCAACGFTQADFKKSGRLGCAQCYGTFAEPLRGLLKSMHKGTRHVGKVPLAKRQSQDFTEKLTVLQKKLHQAIEKEDFEQAAGFRDAIKQIKEQMNQVPADSAGAYES